MLLSPDSDVIARHKSIHVSPVMKFDARNPFDPGDPIPAGHYQPNRAAVRVVQWLTVHFVRQQDIAPERILHGEAARKVFRIVFAPDLFGAVIGGEKYHFDGFRFETAIFKQGRQWRAGPPCIADTADEGGRRAVAGALERRDI